MMFLIVVIKLLLPLPSSKANQNENKITFLLKAMMSRLPMMRRRRKGALTIVNQAMTLMNVERRKLVKRRKNNPLLVMTKHTLLNMSRNSPYTQCMIPQRMTHVDNKRV